MAACACEYRISWVWFPDAPHRTNILPIVYHRFTANVGKYTFVCLRWFFADSIPWDSSPFLTTIWDKTFLNCFLCIEHAKPSLPYIHRDPITFWEWFHGTQIPYVYCMRFEGDEGHPFIIRQLMPDMGAVGIDKKFSDFSGRNEFGCGRKIDQTGWPNLHHFPGSTKMAFLQLETPLEY